MEKQDITSSRTLLDSLPGMAYRCLYEAHCPFIELNHYATILLGHSIDHLLSHENGLEKHIFIDDIDRVLAERKQSISVFGSYDVEYRIVTAEGAIKYVHDRGSLSIQDGQEYLNGFIVDVTKRIKSQKQRKKVEDAVLSTAISPYLAEGNVLEVAKMVSRHLVNILQVEQASVWLFNAARNQLHLICQVEAGRPGFHGGMMLDDSHYPDYFKLVLNSYAIDSSDAVNDERLHEFRDEYFPKTGVVSLLDSAIRVSGEIVGVLCVEQKKMLRVWRDGELSFASQMADQMAQTLNNQKRIDAERKALQSEARSKAKSQFFANMSHEIRTPMNGVLGMASILKMSDLNDEQKHQVSIIEESGGLLLNIIDEILDFSKLEAGKLVLNESPSQIRRLFKNVTDLLQPTVRSGVNLTLSISQSLPQEMLVDGHRLRQVLINLIANALKFTYKGNVEILVDVSEGSLWQFTVKDTGMGIEPELMSRLFEPFERSENAKQIVGAGLGLAICKRLVSLMGGNIEVKSEMNKGSAFTVSLPLKPISTSAEVVTNDNNGNILSHVRVLVAEDNSVNQAVIKGLLKKLGITPDIVENGLEAVRQVTQDASRYDLVLMDCEMPVMDGYTAALEIRRILNNYTLPIAALTAHAFLENKERAIQSGMQYYLTKPINLVQLQELIVDVMMAAQGPLGGGSNMSANTPLPS